MSQVIEAHQLSRRFGRRWAVVRVDLEVPAGHRLLVVGANGSGKTTLLRILATLLSPTVGSLRICGLDPARDRTAARRHLAFLSHTAGLYEDLSATENLRVWAGVLGEPDRSRELLQRAALEERPDAVSTYSAGMRKRLAFARLLLQRPRLALLDEPYGQLDPEGFRFVDGLVAELASQGTAVVVASHLVGRAGAICQEALLLDRGQVRWRGEAGRAAEAWEAVHRGEAR